MKDIKGYEGLYAITEDGRVWSYKRKKWLTQWINHGGYYFVDLYKDKIKKHYSVHRLVGSTFIPNPDNLPEINHKDCNPANNNVNNLEWCNRSYNNTYAEHNKRVAQAKCRRVMCVETGIIYNSLTEAAKQINDKPSNICHACQHPNRTCGGYHWKYVS